MQPSSFYRETRLSTSRLKAALIASREASCVLYVCTSYNVHRHGIMYVVATRNKMLPMIYLVDDSAQRRFNSKCFINFWLPECLIGILLSWCVEKLA